MNLELPFYELPDAELDAFLERIDRQLDALFLDEVHGVLEQVRVDVAGEPAPAAGAA